MEIRDDKVETGWPSQLNLHQRVSAFTRPDRCISFKIGITNNPDKRASLYRGSGTIYHEMVLLYRTSSDTHVRAMEVFLCDYYKESSDNVNAGGGGPGGEGPYYLYLTIQRP